MNTTKSDLIKFEMPNEKFMNKKSMKICENSAMKTLR